MLIAISIFLSYIPAAAVCIFLMFKEKKAGRYCLWVATMFCPQIIYYIIRAYRANGRDVGELAIIICFILPLYLIIEVCLMITGALVIKRRKRKALKDGSSDEQKI